MRWSAQALTVDADDALPGMVGLAGLIRTVRTPEFAGITFHEVRAKSALNRVPASSPMPFRWTVNSYRGCSHGCVYCFARNTHTYLDFDAGSDFDSQIVVKVNIAEVLGKELSRSGWRREDVAMGTNTDPYQRAEGRYRLMPGIIEALAASDTPFSILTKGTVLARDLPLLAEAAQRVRVGLGISLALLEPDLQAGLEPGTPSPKARLDLICRIRAAGLPCGVLVAPVLPFLTDSEEQLRRVVSELVAAGVTGVSSVTLHLRPGTRDWFFRWLGHSRPDLVEPYQQLYRRGANANAGYQQIVAERFRRIRAEFGLAPMNSPVRGVPGDRSASFPSGALPTGRRLSGPGDQGRAAEGAGQSTLF